MSTIHIMIFLLSVIKETRLGEYLWLILTDFFYNKSTFASSRVMRVKSNFPFVENDGVTGTILI
jgi:hypothetical protein